MGLDVSGLGSFKGCSCNIHHVRGLALVVAGHFETITPEDMESWRSNSSQILHRETHDDVSAKWLMTMGFLHSLGRDEPGIRANHQLPWDRYSQFYQLLHFSDVEGYLVPEEMLVGLDCSRSYFLGNSTKLLEELEWMKAVIDANPDFYARFPIAVEMFTGLYALVKDEVENHHGVIIFW